MAIVTAFTATTTSQDAMDTLNDMLADIAALAAGSTPTPTPAPTIALSSSVSKAEGNSGTTSFDYTATLTRNGSTAAFAFTWAVTGNGSNPAGAADFVGGVFPSGSGTFAAGQTTKTISVPVLGDTNVESDEQFKLTISVTNVGTATSLGTILNDDTSGVTPTPIATPVITQSSTKGVAPFEFNVQNDASWLAGYYGNRQRSNSATKAPDGSFATITGDAIHQLSPQDLSTGDVTFEDMPSTPVGPIYEQFRVGREDGNGGYVWGNWSNVLSDTIAPTYNAVLSDTRKSGSLAMLSNGNRTMSATDQGYTLTVSAVDTVALSAAIGYVEASFTWAGNTERGLPVLGLVGPSFDPTQYQTPATRITADGVVFVANQQIGNAGDAGSNGTTWAGMLVHKATGKVWFRTPSGYYPDTPTFNADGSIASGAGLTTGLAGAAINFVVAVRGGDSITINAGQGALAYARPANAPGGWA